MNEILKFKKGRMIPKHQDGGGMYSASDLVEAGNRAFGLALYYDKRTGDLVQIASRDALARDGRVKGEVVRTGSEMQSRPYSVFNITGWKTIGPYQRLLLLKHAITGKTLINAKEETAELNRLNPAGQRRAVAGSRTVSRQRPNYAANFAGMNFTDDEKKYMTDAGFDPTNAKSVQEFILSKNKNANLGARKGAGIADGYWGDESIKAFNALRSFGTFNPVVDAQEPVKPVNETPIDAPDPFGYESKGNYSLDNTNTLKTDGIRDWTTMMNYIKGNQDSAFSQDMMHRFGSDLSKWNQKDVESAMGVSGHYGRNDRSRIQGFMAGNQKAWNNQRQTAINDYAKKTFLKNQAGMNTLGDAGAGTMAQLDVNNMSERLKFAIGV